MTVQHFTRTRQQNIDLCCEAEDAEEDEESAAEAAQPEKEVLGTKDKDFDTTQEVLHFATNCLHCNAPCHTNMKLVNIPYFKEVVIMATNCEACGHRDNEVKSGGGMEEKGRKITLNIQSHRDMTRDVLKSETCSIMIPALEMETSMGTLGGKFTTVEGLLDNIKEQLKGNPFMSGDSSQPIAAGKLSTFCEKVDKIIQGELVNIDFILDDPAGNSYIQGVGKGIVIGIAATFAVFFVVIIVAVVWLWRRQWMLPCAETKTKQENTETGHRESTEATLTTVQQNVPVLRQPVPSQVYVEASEATRGPYEELRPIDVGLKSIYTRLADQNYQDATSTATGSLYENPPP